MFDVLISGDKQIGIGTFEKMSKQEFSRKFGIDISQVHQAEYSATGTMLRRGKLGKTYTYSSICGSMDIMHIIPLSELDGEMSYLYSDGASMQFYPTDHHALEAGVDLNECRKIPLGMAVMFAGTKSDAPMVLAIKKVLLGGAK